MNNVSSRAYDVSLAKGEGCYAGGDCKAMECGVFDGKWKRDDTLPHYSPGSCPLIDRDFNCHLNGRPDKGYFLWRWKPNGCNLPRLNASDILERLRGKKLVFVGDSLNRNMWKSLVCILRDSIQNKSKVYGISGSGNSKRKGSMPSHLRFNKSRRSSIVRSKNECKKAKLE